MIDDEDKLKQACNCLTEKAQNAGTYSDVLRWFKSQRVHEMYAADYERREKIYFATRNCFKKSE